MVEEEKDDQLMLMFQDNAAFKTYLKDNSLILSEFSSQAEERFNSANSKKSPEKGKIISFLNESPEGLYKGKITPNRKT